MTEAAKDATHIYLLGDLFDFWHEYNYAVPKGHVRLLGKLAEWRDSGVPITYFMGNHDLWMYGYFQKELNIPVIEHELQFEAEGKKFFVAHGDGLGPGDAGYKFVKRIFRNRFCQWLFRWLHPDIGIPLALFWSRKSRGEYNRLEKYEGNENEMLEQFCRGYLQSNETDYFIFGHRHLPLDIRLSERSRYINLGDWIHHFTYAVFENGELPLRKYK